ncbi:MAG: hypothetical protein WAT37_19910 [Saprospiraceae bacterium]
MKLHHLFLTLLCIVFVSTSNISYGNNISNEIAFLNNDNKWKINTENQISSGKSLRIRLYLEGAMLNAPNVFGSDGKRLMRDDLRVSPFTGSNYIPLSDPYQKTIKFVNLAVKHKHVGVGSLPQYSTITDSASVFGVTGENAIVDWVFVEIRSANNNKQVIATRSGLLQRDGHVVDVDGVSDLLFPDLSDSEFHVAVFHRNHLGCMSLPVSGGDLIDFTNPQTPVFDFGSTMGGRLNYAGLCRKTNQYGYAMLWAGNFNADSAIKFDPPKDDHNILMMETLGFVESGNFSKGALGYFQGDYDMNSKIKYDNPSDDKNMLFAQVLLYDLNLQLLGNFTYFIEQVPTRNP